MKKRRAVVVVAAAVIAASCVPPPPPGPTPRPAPTPGLAGVAQDVEPCGVALSCALPYPSERYTRPDPQSATGYSVIMPDDVPDVLVDQLGPASYLEELLANSDGFSPLTPIVFEFAENLDPAAVPPDGLGLVDVVDETGAAIDVRVEVSAWSNDRWGEQKILQIWPRTSFEFGSTITATVSDALLALDGLPVSVTPSAYGVDAPDRSVVARTSFTVRTEENATGRTEVMEQIVRSQTHPIRGLLVGPPVLGGAGTVTGQVRVTDFRGPGGLIPRHGVVAPTQRWIDFTLVVPQRAAGIDGAPVVIYGHGLTAFKESMAIVSAENAQKGFATLGIDLPNHGSRVNNGGAIGELGKPSQLYRLADMTVQGSLDQLSLILAVEQSFGAIPGLDTSRILYEGTSMGGYLGVPTIGMAPEIDAAFLQVAGAGVLDTIHHSLVWRLFEGVVPRGGTAAEGHALMAGAQLLLDHGDGANFTHRIRENGTPVFLVYAVDDGIVSNDASHRLESMLGLPAIGPLFSEGAVPDPPRTAIPRDGRGASQISTTQLNGNVLKDLLTHLAFVDDIPMANLRQWLDDRVLDA